MSAISKGYWLGGLTNKLAECLKIELDKYFNITECHNDLSIISEPNVIYCFFYFSSSDDFNKFQSASRLCKNLNRYLIVIYSPSIADKSAFDQPFIYSSISTHDENFESWAANLNLSLRMDFSHQVPPQIVPKSSDTKSPQNSEIADIVQYIDENLPNQLQEEALAEKCHYSVTYFSKLFSKSMGVSFKDYLINKRISLAKEMLIEDKSAKIAVVAYQCGYKDVSYFSRIFKKRTGLTPAIYRQQY
ncbi:AraC family transcriptional regulator [Vibrio sp. FNV 38]|nr:AraC family transcriptional regulator [Vibrio sp. FNV 38]